MQVVNCRNALSQVLSSCLLIKPALLLQQRVDLALGTILEDQIKVIVVLIMVIEFEDMIVIKFVHNLNLKLYLLDQIMFNNLLLVNDLDREHVFRYFMPHLINLSKSTHSNIAVGDALKIVLAALPFFASHD